MVLKANPIDQQTSNHKIMDNVSVFQKTGNDKNKHIYCFLTFN